MKLTLLLASIFAEPTIVPLEETGNVNTGTMPPLRHLYEIRKHVDNIIDSYLDCSARGISAKAIKKNMNGLLNRIEKKFTKCWKKTPGRNPPFWKPRETKPGRRKRNGNTVQFIAAPPELAIHQLGQGLIRTWMDSHSEQYPCNFERDGSRKVQKFEQEPQAQKLADNFERWANRKMMVRLIKCNGENATSD